MLQRIKEYDDKVKALIEPVTVEDIKQTLEDIAKNQFPRSYYRLEDDGRIIEEQDRLTGQLFKPSTS